MTKEEVKNCFESILTKYPQKEYIRHNDLAGIKSITKHYLHKEHMKEWQELPE